MVFSYVFICLTLYFCKVAKRETYDTTGQKRARNFVVMHAISAIATIPTLVMGAVLLSEDLIDEKCKIRFVPIALAVFLVQFAFTCALAASRIPPESECVG